MPRGGARPGSGPQKGTKYRTRLRLTGETSDAGSKQTPSQRMADLKRQVALWIAGDMTVEEIAAVLGLEVDKVKALFPREIEHGRAITRASLLARLDGAGNVAADKRLLDEIVPSPPDLTPPPPPKTVGKKNAAQETADAVAAAGGIFAPPQYPAREGERNGGLDDLRKPDGERLQ